jgi:hypothetical protein
MGELAETAAIASYYWIDYNLSALDLDQQASG